MKTLYSCMDHSKWRIDHIQPCVKINDTIPFAKGFCEKDERGYIVHKPKTPYFIGGSGYWYSYQAISDLIRKYLIYAPELKGVHIKKQLEFLGILEEFETGITKFQLPFTFY